MEGKQSALDVAKIEASSRQNETGTHLEHRGVNYSWQTRLPTGNKVR
jgi:hypothetical protein